MANHHNDFIWVEKYRPRKVTDCIIPKALKKTLSEVVKKKQIPNMIFSGAAGCGKTSTAKAICNELDAQVLFINASNESGIDTLRTKITEFATTVSLTGQTKVVILDEADYLNPQSTQPALRAFIEEYSDNCRFIFTCNYPSKIIQPLHSRCSTFDFTINAAERKNLLIEFLQRIESILTEENIQYDMKAVAKHVQKHFPDFRKTLNELDSYAKSGIIDEGILGSFNDLDLENLINGLKTKNLKSVREWVVESLGNNDSIYIFRKIYENLKTTLKPMSIPQVIVLIGEYQYRAAFVQDQEINLMAFFVELMSDSQFM